METCPNPAGAGPRVGAITGWGVPKGFGPEAGPGCTMLLSVGRVLLPNGTMSSSADISTVRDDFAACGWPFHDWLVTPAAWVDAQQTPDAEPTAEDPGTDGS